MRKPRRNPFSRARAKRWFSRSFGENFRIVAHDGATTFLIEARRPGLVHIRSTRFGHFLFTEEVSHFLGRS